MSHLCCECWVRFSDMFVYHTKRTLKLIVKKSFAILNAKKSSNYVCAFDFRQLDVLVPTYVPLILFNINFRKWCSKRTLT